MKKYLVLFIFPLLITLVSCSQSKIQYPSQSTDSQKTSTPTVLSQTTENNSISQDYKIISFNATFDPSGGDGIVTGVIKYKMIDMGKISYGELLNYQLDSSSVDLARINSEFARSNVYDRLNLGYFYVLNGKVWRFNSAGDDIAQLKSGTIPKDATLIYQTGGLKDSLIDAQTGLHHYIDFNNDTCESYLYSTLGDTSYYENMIWQKNIGITYFRSGWGAEADGIELKLIQN